MKQSILFLFFPLIGVFANIPIPKPSCDSSMNVSVRYASSSNRIYVESSDGSSRGGCSSLTHIYETLGSEKSPLQPLGDDEWYLESELYVLDGITLEIFGTSVGGDCDYLKMKSDNTGHVYIRAHGGSLDILSTEVSSWDMSKGSVDTDYEDGRAYLSAISELVADPSETCKGVAKGDLGEARMDIEDSIISYLGYSAAESYGLSLKLRGLCNDNSNEKSYEGIAVYGDIRNSDISHMYFGHYSYGAANSVITGNKFYNHIGYCIDPHNRSSNLTISNNEMYGCGDHGAIFSKFCDNVIIKDNYIHDNNGVGIFAHFLSENALIKDNRVEDNKGSGVAFLESSGGVVTDNVVRRNIHGVRFSVGSRDNTVIGNSFYDNSGYDVYTYAGSDKTVEQIENTLVNNVIFRNLFSGNQGGFRFDDSMNTQFVENEVIDAETFRVTSSTGLLLSGNDFPEGMSLDTSGSCVETISEDPCGDEPLEVFTSADADRLLDEDASVSTSSTGYGFGTPSPVADLTASPTITFEETSTPTLFTTGNPSVAPTGQPTVVTDRDIFINSMSSFSPSSSPTSSPTFDISLIPDDDEVLEGILESGAYTLRSFFSKSLIFVSLVNVFIHGV